MFTLVFCADPSRNFNEKSVFCNIVWTALCWCWKKANFLQIPDPYWALEGAHSNSTESMSIGDFWRFPKIIKDGIWNLQKNSEEQARQSSATLLFRKVKKLGLHRFCWTVVVVALADLTTYNQQRKGWLLLHFYPSRNGPKSHHDSTSEANASATICIGHNVTIAYAQKGDGN